MKRILTSIFLVLAITFSAVGCGENLQMEIVVSQPSKLYEDCGRLCVQNSDGNWVFIDENGKVVVETDYTTLIDSSRDPFASAGVAIFKNEDKQAILNSNGDELAVFTNDNNIEYWIWGFDQNKISRIEKIVRTSDGAESFWGIIDNSGKLIADFIYKDIYKFSNAGYAIFENKDEKFGLIDKTGKVIIEAKYDDKDDVPSFSKNGLAAKKKVTENGFASWGFINTNEDWIIQPQFKSVSNFQNNGLSKVRTKDGYGIIDKSGKILTSQSFESISDYKYGVAVTSLDKKYGLINESGEILANNYDEIEIVTSQFAKVKLGDKKGYITLDGKKYLECNFDDVGSVGANGLIAAKDGKEWGYVDKKGSWIIEPIFSSAGAFKANGYAVIAIDNKYGLINKNGEYAVEPEYKSITNYDVRGITAAKVARSWIFLNTDGQKVGSIPTEPLWYYPGDGYYITCSDSTKITYSIIKDGKEIISGLREIAYDP